MEAQSSLGMPVICPAAVWTFLLTGPERRLGEGRAGLVPQALRTNPVVQHQYAQICTDPATGRGKRVHSDAFSDPFAGVPVIYGKALS